MFGEMNRAEKVTIEAYDEKGKKFSRGASGLLAQIFQHEMDHLNGVLFTDTATNLEKIETKKKSHIVKLHSTALLKTGIGSCSALVSHYAKEVQLPF